MKENENDSKNTAADRDSIRRRVKRLYECFNREDWTTCYSLIDPKLRSSSKIDFKDYQSLLESFKGCYGKIEPWYIRISLHIEEAKSKRDDRPFAYVYVVWQDSSRAFHVFRERWIKDSGHWYTRVLGLIPHKETTGN